MNDRDNRLLAFLDRVGAVPNDDGDWAEVVERASAGRWGRRWVWRVAPVLALAALAGVLVVLLVQTSDSGEVKPGGEPAPPAPERRLVTVDPGDTEGAAGEQLFRENACLSCHAIGRVGPSGPGPNLTNEGAKGRGVPWQIAHLRNPGSKTPGSTMPAFTGFSDDQARQIATLLEGLGTRYKPVDPAPLTSIALFDRPQRDDERNGTWLSTSDAMVDVTTSRIAATTARGIRVWVARTTNGQVCLRLTVPDDPLSGPPTCRDLDLIAFEGALTLGVAGLSGAPLDVVGLLTDESRAARSGQTEVAVTDNVFVLPVPSGNVTVDSPIEVLGPAGWQRIPTTPGPDPGVDVPTQPAELPSPKSAYTVKLLNGSGVAGAASRLMPALQARGWSTALPGNAPYADLDVSFMLVVPGKEDVADNLARDLGIRRKQQLDPTTQPHAQEDVDAIAIIGKDLGQGP